MLLLGITSSVRRAVAGTCFVLVTVGVAHSAQVMQNFDTEPADWIGVNNRTGFDDFGFSDTNNVGLGAGEAGGLIARDDSQSSYSTNIGGLDPSTENISLTGTAVFKAPNPDFFMLGYFTPSAGTFAGDGRPRNFFGLYSDDRNLFLMANADGAFGFLNLSVQPAIDAVWTFDLSYDPSGNSGGGTITGSVAGAAVNYNLNAGAKDAFLNFTEFGILSRVSTNADRATATFVDNLTYTVPEPT